MRTTGRRIQCSRGLVPDLFSLLQIDRWINRRLGYGSSSGEAKPCTPAPRAGRPAALHARVCLGILLRTYACAGQECLPFDGELKCVRMQAADIFLRRARRAFRCAAGQMTLSTRVTRQTGTFFAAKKRKSDKTYVRTSTKRDNTNRSAKEERSFPVGRRRLFSYKT